MFRVLQYELAHISFTKRNLLLDSKQQKNDRSPYSFSKIWRFTTIAKSSRKEKAAFFKAGEQKTREIMRCGMCHVILRNIKLKWDPFTSEARFKYTWGLFTTSMNPTTV